MKRFRGQLPQVAASILCAGIPYSLWLGVLIVLSGRGEVVKGILRFLAPFVTAAGFAPIALCIKNGNQGPSYRRHLAGCREGILPSFGGGTPPVQPPRRQRYTASRCITYAKVNKTSITSAYTRLAAADARNVRGRHRDTSQCIRFFAGINARYSGSPLLHSSWYSCLWPSASLTIAASTAASRPFARCTWAVSEMGEHAATSAGDTLSTRRT